ncbi:MAG: hypothetical protein K0R51_2461 [Cytophagaceae bacterium]|jgi:hypothetical protein|nr:hypothetical protein [Cytophagaceae bacterium]
MISQNINFKTRFLVAVILTFSGITDVVLGELILHRSIDLGPILLVLALLFILQDLFLWVRIAFLLLIGALVLYQVGSMILNSFTILENILKAVTEPAAIPLYVSYLIIGILSFLFLKTDVIIQRKA